MNNQRLQEIIRFIIAGLLGAAIEFSLLYALTEYGGVHYLVSAAFAFCTAVVAHYFLCARYVFAGARAMSWRQTTAFAASSVIGLGLNQAGMWWLVEWCGQHYIIAKIIMTGGVAAWNYFAKRYALQNL